jgi:cell division septum initiation protein DivIVA
MFDAAGSEVSFTVRLIGFDRQEVRAFIANIVEDYERACHELEQLRGQEPLPDKAIESPDRSATAQSIQRILEGAQRVADDIERRAAEEGAQIARRQLASFESRAASLQTHGLRLRAAFEAAADTAASALSELATKEFVSELPEGATADVAARR